MTNDNKVSAILPVYKNDKSEYVKLSIDSILMQTYSNIELNIGVDGPIGDTLKNTLVSYEEDDRIRLHWFNENRGLAIVLNDLLEDSFKKGFKYIARMDADDISMPDRLEKQIAFLEAAHCAGQDDEQKSLQEVFGYPESKCRVVLRQLKMQ